MSAAATYEDIPLLLGSAHTDSETTSAPRKTFRWLAHKTVTILISLCALLVVISLSLYSHNKPQEKNLCTTPACIHASSEILHNLSPNFKSIDPCTNFEELVCGGWNERHDLRSDQGDAFTGTVMTEESETILRHILEAPYKAGPKRSNIQSLGFIPMPRSALSIDEENFIKLKLYYDACMDMSNIQKQGMKPLIKIILQIVALFPVSDSEIRDRTLLAASDDEKLSETLLFLQELGIPGFISFDTGADDKNPNVVVVRVSPPSQIGLPAKNYYKNIPLLQKYKDSISQILDNLNLSHWQDDQTNVKYMQLKSSKPNLSTPTYLAAEVIEFEKKLSLAIPNASDRNDVTKFYNVLSIENVEKLIPQIHFSHVLKKLTPSGFTADSLIVASPEYMKSISTTLQDSPKGVIQAFLIWKCIQALASTVEAEEMKPYTRFSNELAGKDPESIPDRWRKCVIYADNGLGLILGRFFVEKSFSKTAKIIGDRIISDIRESFIQRLQIIEWMDLSVVKLAIKKVQKIVQKIGYPSKSPNILNPVELKEYYSNLNITTDYFENHLSSRRFLVARGWDRLGKPVDHDEWSMTVPMVNAYYNPPGNEIVFPAGIMQFPVFGSDLPQYLNYGAFGSIAGHELSHAFDSLGRHYDQNGNYTDWWTNSTVENFEKRAKCFVDQFAKFTVPGLDDKPLHIDGKLTLGENIADAGGVRASFLAWKKRQAKTPDQDLPGLEYFSQDQLFFVSFGNWWCGKSRKETAVSQIYSDPHSPTWARILGTMANSRHFKESFNCAVKEPVCELW